MKRVYCVVEGQTEVAVFYAILNPYIYEKTGVYIEFNPIKKSKGGIVKYDLLFPELRNHLADKGKIVTTFFDYYGIHENHGYPNYKEAKIDQKNAKVGVNLLENGIKDDLDKRGLNTRNFIPYIQLHEFEALLFSSDKGFEFQFDNPLVLRKLKEVCNRFPNPEDINDSPITAPNKRLELILKDSGERYDKVFDGEVIATIIGMEEILIKCPRFRNWIEVLIEKIKE